jgi:tRNA 2-thiouridine synthesizing protein E
MSSSVSSTTAALDEHGHLRDFAAWTPALAEAMARADGLELTAAHWQVIDCLRNYYVEFEIAPPMRALVKILREQLQDPDLASRALYRLFPEGPAKQGCRYAGLPKPVSCI